MANVFDAQVKAVDSFSGPISRMVKGMGAIIAAARGVTKASTEGSKSAAKAAGESAHAIEKTAHKASKAATEAAKESAHAAEVAVHHAEAAHLRYIRTMSAHVRLLHGHFGELHASIGEIGNSLKELLPALGALGAGATLAGMFEMTKETAEAAIAMDAAAQQAGVTAREYAGLAWAAKESGLSAETMHRGMERLSVTMGDVSLGKNKEAAAVFTHLKISMKDSAGQARNTVDVLKDLAEAFSKTKDPTLRAAAAQILMSRAGKEMLPILMQGREGVAELVKAGEEFADIGSDEERKKLEEFGHTWGEMDAAAEGFKTRLSTELAPALKPIIEFTRDWIMANRDWIATSMAHRVTALKGVIEGVLGAIKDVHDGTRTWSDVLRGAITNHVELTAVIGGMMLVLGSPLLTALTRAGNAMLLLGKIVRGVSLLMMASPMIAGLTILATIGLAIYENWFGLGDLFDTILAKIQPLIDKFKEFGEWVRDSKLGRLLGGAPAPTPDAVKAMAPTAQSPATMATYDDTGLGPDGLPINRGPGGALYRPGGPALAAAQQRGEVRVKIDFANAPPGTQVRTDANGIAQAPETSVGYSSPFPFAFGGT